MRRVYFIVTLTTGRVMDMQKRCNSVDYQNEKVCVFKHEERKVYTTLAIIPHNQIRSIERVEEWDYDSKN